MPGPDDIELVAVIGAGAPLADRARRCWDEGRAVLPINPGFTSAEITTLLARLRPTAVADLRTGDT
ncbi:MAG: hypothetical protein ACRD0Z_11930, partial [Acidimicrobiales bacterium]